MEAVIGGRVEVVGHIGKNMWTVLVGLGHLSILDQVVVGNAADKANMSEAHMNCSLFTYIEDVTAVRE